MLGDLTEVDAGFVTPLGEFSNSAKVGRDGVINQMVFRTPLGTSGSVSVPGVEGKLVNSDGRVVVLTNGVVDGLGGGFWTLVVEGEGGLSIT